MSVNVGELIPDDSCSDLLEGFVHVASCLILPGEVKVAPSSDDLTVGSVILERLAENISLHPVVLQTDRFGGIKLAILFDRRNDVVIQNHMLTTRRQILKDCDHDNLVDGIGTTGSGLPRLSTLRDEDEILLDQLLGLLIPENSNCGVLLCRTPTKSGEVLCGGSLLRIVRELLDTDKVVVRIHQRL